MQKQPIIYHNQTCSKCMLAMHIMEEKGFEPLAINYIQSPLNRRQLQDLLQQLHLAPGDLVRKNEPLFIEKFDETKMQDDDYLEALVKYPELMQRPVVVFNGKAIIARPPYRVSDLF